jgi:hypothetical protein
MTDYAVGDLVILQSGQYAQVTDVQRVPKSLYTVTILDAGKTKPWSTDSNGLYWFEGMYLGTGRPYVMVMFRKRYSKKIKEKVLEYLSEGVNTKTIRSTGHLRWPDDFPVGMRKGGLTGVTIHVNEVERAFPPGTKLDVPHWGLKRPKSGEEQVADIKKNLDKFFEKEKAKHTNPCQCGVEYLKQGIVWWCEGCKTNYVVE